MKELNEEFVVKQSRKCAHTFWCFSTSLSLSASEMTQRDPICLAGVYGVKIVNPLALRMSQLYIA